MSDPFSMAVAGLGSIKTALDITKTLSDARDTSKLLSVKLELQRLLLEAQETQAQLVAEKRQLEERVRELEAWDRERERYELKDVGQGCLAYCLRESAAAAEPPHSLCVNCYNRGHKSILVPFHINIGRAAALQCHECGSEMVVRGVDGRESARIHAKMSAPKNGGARRY